MDKFEKIRSDIQAGFSNAQVQLSELGFVEAIIKAYPGLAFIKRLDPSRNRWKAVAFSDFYVLHIFGDPMKEYVGLTDFDFWDYETAAAFHRHDMAAFERKRLIVNEEYTSPITGNKGAFKGVKWTVSHNDYVYLIGMSPDERAII